MIKVQVVYSLQLHKKISQLCHIDTFITAIVFNHLVLQCYYSDPIKASKMCQPFNKYTPLFWNFNRRTRGRLGQELHFKSQTQGLPVTCQFILYSPLTSFIHSMAQYPWIFFYLQYFSTWPTKAQKCWLSLCGNMQHTSAETDNTVTKFWTYYLQYVLVLLKTCSILDSVLLCNDKIYPPWCLKWCALNFKIINATHTLCKFLTPKLCRSSLINNSPSTATYYISVAYDVHCFYILFWMHNQVLENVLARHSIPVSSCNCSWTCLHWNVPYINTSYVEPPYSGFSDLHAQH